MKFPGKVLFVALVIVALALLAPTATFAATPAAPDISVSGCQVTISFDAAVAGATYNFRMWDDGVLVENQTKVAGAVGELIEFVFSYSPSDVGSVAPGIGLQLYENGEWVWGVDPWNELDECISAGCDTLMPITATSVVGSFVADAPLYYEPGNLVEPATAITAGNTAWVLGKDASGAYYKIIWGCDLLWVPVGTMGPNFDAVWNGTPLPTGVVE